MPYFSETPSWLHTMQCQPDLPKPSKCSSPLRLSGLYPSVCVLTAYVCCSQSVCFFTDKYLKHFIRYDFCISLLISLLITINASCTSFVFPDVILAGYEGEFAHCGLHTFITNPEQYFGAIFGQFTPHIPHCYVTPQ